MLDYFADFGEAVEAVRELRHDLVAAVHLFFRFFKYLADVIVLDHVLNQAIGSFMSFHEIYHDIIGHGEVAIYQHLEELAKKGYL